MGLKHTPWNGPIGGAQAPWWTERCADADLAREIAYAEHLRLAQQGVLGWQELPNRLREAYRRIQAELYSFTEGDAA